MEKGIGSNSVTGEKYVVLYSTVNHREKWEEQNLVTAEAGGSYRGQNRVSKNDAK